MNTIIFELFNEIIDTPPKDIHLYIEGKSLSEEQKAQLYSLLSNYEKTHDKATVFRSLIASESDQILGDYIIDSLSGMQIDQFKIRECLGAGGMGVVHRAERNDDELTQISAFKFLYPSVRDVIGENILRYEAQLLLRLDNQYIAKLYDANTTESGLHYFRMEYIKGISLDAYLAEFKPSTTEKQQLFIKICEAIKHTHEKQVIHGDLKPSNILITEDGIPKIIDYGIGKSIDLFEDSPNDKFHIAYTLALSHQFSSPDQKLGKTINVQDDIYSLGKILGQSLFPNTNKKELEAIINKCVNSELENRYKTVYELKNDIDCMISHYPVQAFSEAKSYHIKKFIYRNKLAVIFSISLFLLTVSSSIIVTLKNYELEITLKNEQVVASFMQSIFSYVDKSRFEKIGGFTIEEVLDELSKKAVTELEEYPRARYSVLFMLAKSYRGAKEWEKALSIMDKLPSLYDIQSEPFLAVHYYVSKLYIYDALGELGELDLAVQTIKEAEKLTPKLNINNDDENIALMTFSFAKSFIQVKSKDYTGSIKTAKSTLEEFSNSLDINMKASLYNTIGVSYIRMEDFANGMLNINKSIEVQKQKFNLYRAMKLNGDTRDSLINFFSLQKSIERALGHKSILYGRVLIELAQINRILNQCNAALPYIQDAKKILSTHKKYFQEAIIESNQIEECTITH